MSRISRFFIPFAVAGATAGTLLTAPAASAAPSAATTVVQTTAARTTLAVTTEDRTPRASRGAVTARMRGASVIRVAKTLRGVPYRYGGSTPRGFDCSGFTMYVYRRALGVSMPHMATAQAWRSTRVSRAQAVPGDLVFFWRGGRSYHVAIYAGGNKIYHASRPGTPVRLANIWSSNVSFGRI